MRLDKNTLIAFADSLPDRVKSHRDVILKTDQRTWDSRVRGSFAEVVTAWLCHDFALMRENGNLRG